MSKTRNIIHPRAIVHKTAVLEAPIRLNRYANIASNTSVGHWTYFSDFSSLARECQIGRYCSVAKFVEIGAVEHPTDFLSTHPFQYSTHHWKGHEEWDTLERVPYDDNPGTHIGHDVWIGAKAIIARGVTVGNGAIIGAGAFVNKDVPAYAVVVGSPAYVLRYRFPEGIIARLQAVQWWNRPLTELSGIPFDDIEAALSHLEALDPLPE